MWSEKYRPSDPVQMVGNEESRIGFIGWLKSWRRGGRPALLVGPPGLGKTTLVHAVAKSLGYTVIELNASDVRTKERLEKKLGPSLASLALLEEKLLIFLDEVDGIYGRQDYGGAEFVQQIIEKGRVPIVMAANVEDDQKIKRLVSRSEVFRFKRIPPRLVELYLRHILEREGCSLDGPLIQEVVRSSLGDMRAAINNLQAVVSQSEAPLGSLLTRRDERLSLNEGLNAFFEAETDDKAYEAIRSCDALPRDKVRAIFTSIVRSRLKTDEMVSALEELSKADELLGEIGRTQEWRLLRYLDRMLAYSLHRRIPRGLVRYEGDDLPWSLKVRVWNEARLIRELGISMARAYHISRRDAIALYLPYLSLVLSRSKGLVRRFVGFSGLGEGVERFLTKEVARLVQRVAG